MLYFVHDGMIFYTSHNSVKLGSNLDIIGFYFDNNCICHEIRKESLYGKIIQTQLKKSRKKNKE